MMSCAVSIASAPDQCLTNNPECEVSVCNMTEELGKGLTISNLKPDAYGRVRLPVLYRLDGMEDVDRKQLLKFEMHRAGSITNTDLVTVDEHACESILPHARDVAPRRDESGARSALSSISSVRKNGTARRPLAWPDAI